MKNLIITALIASTSLFSCKSQSGAMGADRIEPSNSTNNKTVNQSDDTYDMIISFISVASGIDREVKTKVDNVIEEFNSKNKTNITPEKISWGREGEVDYNFKFKNLSTAQKKDFAAKIKAAIGSSELVFVAFNKKSVHKR